jgi:hypothetical protein
LRFCTFGARGILSQTSFLFSLFELVVWGWAHVHCSLTIGEHCVCDGALPNDPDLNRQYDFELICAWECFAEMHFSD